MAGSHGIALSELIAALSRALDIGEGEPPGHAMRSCLIGMRLAEALGLDPDARSDLFYALLLKDAGCSANSAHMAALFGADDQAAKRTSKLVNWSRPFDAFLWSLRTVAPDGSVAERTARLRAIRNEGQVTRSLMRARCYRGAEIARKLGFSEATAEAIRALDEHWDGHGQPHAASGMTMPMRVLAVADVFEALTSDRPYRLAYAPREALELMRRDVPQRLDRDAFAALGALVQEHPLGGPVELTGVPPSLRRIK